MHNQDTGNYTIIPGLFSLPFESIKKFGAFNLSDIDHLDILIGLRNNYLIIAKDLLCNPDRDYRDYEFGVLNCEMAEKIQEVIELWETEVGVNFS